MPLYDRLIKAKAPQMVVISAVELRSSEASAQVQLRPGDISYNDFKGAVPCSETRARSWWPSERSVGPVEATATQLPYIAGAYEHTNINFSSGTTGEPKAIAWTHVTPLRCFADGWAHQDIRPGLSA